MSNPQTKRFGRYEVLGELGRGAMGVVYKGRDPQIDRFVAIKTIALSGQIFEHEKEFRERFTFEAQAAGRLQHPGIVAIFDVGEDPENHEPYLVLEFVEGENLNRALSREQKLAPGKAMQLVEEIARALDYAHAQGVVHRDIKPGNILITRDGHAKIGDFGIATLNLAHFTLPGEILGTPAYMAPEQLTGRGVDGRSDLFSLGVILYVLVTGHSPFPGNSATTVCHKVTNREPIPASALDLNLPRGLDVIISRAMAKDPGQRYQRGSEFANDLQQMLQQADSGPNTTSRQLAALTGIRYSPLPDGPIRPFPEPRQAEQMAYSLMRKAPLRDLLLAVTAALLVIAAIRFNFLGADHRDITATDLAPNSTPRSDNRAQSSAMRNRERPPSIAAAERPVPTITGSIFRRSPTAALLGAKPIIGPPSTLELSVRHEFKDATLFVWIDDQLLLTRSLHGGPQRHLVVFNEIHGVESETLNVPAGRHLLRLRAISSDGTVDLSRTASAEFVGGGDRSLEVVFEKHNTSMQFTWH